MQDIEKLCLGCMKIKVNGESRCPYCGFAVNEYKRNSRWLPLQHILNGKYMLGKVIGEGGFGITYIGWDLNMEVRVAVKEYFPIGFASREVTENSRFTISSLTGEKRDHYVHGLQKFAEEARSLAKFYQLDGIVSVKDFFYENETAYMVMEYVDGITLKEYLHQQGGRMSAEDAMWMLKPVIQALQVIHKEQIIHRDISPDNLMITRDNRIKLIDFGAARMACNDESHTFTIILKHGYAPPEQYQTKGHQGPWSDVYAICATLYYMITGELPPNAMDRVVKDELKSFEEMGYHVPDGFSDTVIKNGMALQSAKRYQNMESLYTALYERTAKEKSNKPEGKKRAGIIVLLSGLVVLAAAGMSVWNRKKPENEIQMTQTETTQAETTQTETTRAETIQAETAQAETTQAETLPSEVMSGICVNDKEQALFYGQRNDMQNLNVGDSFAFGAFEQDNNASNGKEEIEWTVLDKKDNKICVISKKALATRDYTDGEKGSAWEESELRKWLNEEFLPNAFSEYHQQMILNTNVRAENNSSYTTAPGSNTEDKVYLLSESEVKKYFPEKAERICQPTVYAKVHGSYLDDGNGWWWLRTPGEDENHTSVVDTYGEIQNDGMSNENQEGTVRPVMWLDIADLSYVDIPEEFTQEQISQKKIVAIDPSCIGVETDESHMQAMGPGAEEEECFYTTGGVGQNTGVREYNIDLGVAECLREILLERGYQVVMLREDNTSKLSAMNRSLAAAEAGADIQVIVSCRKRQDIGERGAMTYSPSRENPYVADQYDDCRRLAECILTEYVNTGIFEDNGIYENDQVRGINWSKIPVTNVLIGCITDASDEKKLADQSNWKTMAEGIANGIDKYFKEK